MGKGGWRWVVCVNFSLSLDLVYSGSHNAVCEVSTFYLCLGLVKKFVWWWWVGGC